MPPRPARGSFSLRRVAWLTCLLASLLVVAFQAREYHRNRVWDAAYESARSRYDQWAAAARREALARVGEIDGLTREQVTQRLKATLSAGAPLGPDEFVVGMLPAEPPRERPVVWCEPNRNWLVAVTMYDGRADGLDVDMIHNTIPRPRQPRSATLWLYFMVLACDAIIFVCAAAMVPVWMMRRDHRAVAHACLQAAAFAVVIVLAEDWQNRTGFARHPALLDPSAWLGAPWEGPAFGLIVGFFALRVPRRPPLPGVCPRCGYDLTGNASGRCPECGTEITVLTPSTPPSPSRG